MLAWAFALARLWTWIYTSGMPAALRDARRAEIESDLWESAHASDPTGTPTAALHVIVRLFRGIPDDFLWRAELMDLRTRRHRPAAWLTLGVTLLAAALWVRAATAPLELPDLPSSPITIQAWLMHPVPPPPPPPPPPETRGQTRSSGLTPTPPPYRPQGRDLMPPPPARPPRAMDRELAGGGR